MLNKVKSLIPLAGATIALALPTIVRAADNKEPIVPGDTLGNTFNIISVIQAIIRFVLIVGFVIAFIMLIVGGIRWILAGGDEKAVASARGTITAALIGLVIVLVAYGLIRLVELFFGVTIISGDVCIPVIGGAENCDITKVQGTTN